MADFKEFTMNITIRNTDPVVRDHRVYQVRIMPGVTFLDITLRALRMEGYQTAALEFRNILFKEPIVTADAFDVKVRLTLKSGGEYGLITAESRKFKGDQVLSDWALNYQCELHESGPNDSGTLDIDGLQQAAIDSVTADEAYGYVRRLAIFHYDFMKVRGKIDKGPGYLLASFHLSDLARKYLDHCYIHPAFLDASTLAPIEHARLDPEIPFIPMYIESFRALDRVDETCYVFVNDQDIIITGSKDVMYADIKIYHPDGRLVASFRRLAFKKVRSREMIQTLTQWQPHVSTSGLSPAPSVREGTAPVDGCTTDLSQFIEADLQRMISGLLRSPVESVSLETGFYDQGLNSENLLYLVRELEGKIGRQLYPTLLFEYTNIRELAAYLAREFQSEYPVDPAQTGVADFGTAREQAGERYGDSRSGMESQPLIKDQIAADLREMIAAIRRKPVAEISLEQGYYDQGLDSGNLLQLVRDLEQRLNQQLYPTLLFEYTNIMELAEYLAREYGDRYTTVSGPKPGTGSAQTPETVYYSPQWEPVSLEPVGPINTGDLLVFTGDDRIVAGFNRILADEGSRVIQVEPSHGRAEKANGHFLIDPANPADYQWLITTLQERNMLPVRIVHHWAALHQGGDEQSFQEALRLGFYSIFHISRALLEQKPKIPIRLQFHYPFVQDEPVWPVWPLHGALNGFNRTLNLESPKLIYQTLGMNPLADPVELSHIIIQEFKAINPTSEIRYQAGRRFVKNYHPVVFTPETNPVLKEKGVYLITGGAGGLGLIIARHLAEQYRARLVLAGRSELSGPQQKQIRELEALGAEVLYISADVSQEPAVHQLVAKAKSRFGAIHGVIHAAGVTRDSLIFKKNPAELDTVFAAKIAGTIHLDLALQEEPLDFFAVFSSSSAVTGNIGQADYAYANSFMDHYMEFRAQLTDLRQGTPMRSGKSIAINWPLWRDGGMKVDRQTEEMLRASWGMVPLETADGLRAFENSLGWGSPQLLVMAGDTKRIHRTLSPQRTGPNIESPAVLPKPVERPKSLAINPVQPLVRDEIAIIGLAGRYPQAHNIAQFWENLKNGRDSISEIPKDRWDLDKYFDPDKNKTGAHYTKWGGFMDDVDKFDPLFFNIAPREAETMDPQERLFLETVWHTLEDAGYTRAELAKERVGVFVGVMWGQYQLFSIEQMMMNHAIYPTSSYASVANRVSYCLNLRGPSLAVDTMCSSSLTAIHLACDSLIKGESDLALAGGVNLTLHPVKYLYLSQNKFVSSDGRCRSFGAGGDGYVPGEGVGAILLKPLRKAVADGDHIYGVIKGSAINHGGNTNGYTVPNPHAQASVIAECFKKAGVDPKTVNYIEAHGTGTSLGDPIEITGLMKAVGEATREKQYCAIGSVKSNIGHLESAAGIAAITKVLLQMEFKQLVPSIHSEELNPNINFTDSAFYLQHQLAEWKPATVEDGRNRNYPRRAGVSSFGAGGSNAHMVLEEYIDDRSRNSQSGPQIFILSARNEERLKVYAREMLDFIQKNVAHRESDTCDDGMIPWIRWDLVQMVSELLQISETVIDVQENIFEFGFDPVRLSRMENRLKAYYPFDFELCPAWHLEVPSIQSLAEYFNAHYSSLVAKFYQGKPEPVNLQAGGPDLTGWFDEAIYTLMVGREPMEERLAIVVSDIHGLAGALNDFCQGISPIPNLFRGNSRTQAKGTQTTSSQGVETGGVEALQQLAERWVSGEKLDWRQLFYASNPPRRITLPVYPFEQKHYWFDSYQGHFGNKPTVESREMGYVQPSGKPQEKPSEKPPVVLKPRNVGPIVIAGLDKVSDYSGPEVSLQIIDNHIALITMQDKINKNTFSEPVIKGLIARFTQVRRDERIKAIVITGYDNIFCMGGTQEQLLDISDRKYNFADIPFLYKGFLEAEVPVIAAIQGHASGGGLMFGLFADMVIMSEEGVYSAVFTKYGFTPGMGATFILKEKFGNNLATEMMYTAKSYRGMELKERGASVIYKTKEQVLPEAIAIARMLAEKPLQTLKVLKKELAGRVLAQLPEIIEQETWMHEQTFGDPEVKQRIGRYYGNSGQKAQVPDNQPKIAPKPQRISLKPTTARPGVPAATASEPGSGAGAMNEAMLEELLIRLENGQITPDQALKLKRGY